MPETSNADIPAVRASVKYIIDPGQDRLIYVPSEAGHDNSKWAGQYREHMVDIHDARAASGPEGGFDLDREGFTLWPQETAVTDFYDDSQISETYEPEIEALLKQATGAARVHIFDHTRRAASKTLREDRVVREPAGVIHNDYTDASAAKRVRDLFPADEAADLLSRRFAIINVWRSSNGAPIETAPLALCDAGSVDDGDLITVERHSKDRIGEVLQVIENPKHRWFYFPRLKPDEALLLKTYDSATDGRAKFSVHTAFEDPTVPADAPPRESIETRAFLFF